MNTYSVFSQGLTPEKFYADFSNVSNKKDKAAKNFSAMSLSGAKFDLVGMRGHVVVLNIWTTSCVHCIDEMRDFNRMKRKFKGRHVFFMALDPVDNLREIKSFLKNHTFNYDILYAPNSAFFSDYTAIAYPTNYVINKRGFFSLAKQGYEKNNAYEVAQAVARSL